MCLCVAVISQAQGRARWWLVVSRRWAILIGDSIVVIIDNAVVGCGKLESCGERKQRIGVVRCSNEHTDRAG